MHGASHNYCLLVHQRLLHSATKSMVPDHLEEISGMTAVSLCCVLSILWEWEVFSLSAAVQTNIWPACGRTIKDEDINRGRGATRGQRGTMWGLEVPQKGHRGSYFHGIQSQQGTKGALEKDLSVWAHL